MFFAVEKTFSEGAVNAGTARYFLANLDTKFNGYTDSFT